MNKLSLSSILASQNKGILFGKNDAKVNCVTANFVHFPLVLFGLTIKTKRLKSIISCQFGFTIFSRIFIFFLFLFRWKAANSKKLGWAFQQIRKLNSNRRSKRVDDDKKQPNCTFMFDSPLSIWRVGRNYFTWSIETGESLTKASGKINCSSCLCAVKLQASTLDSLAHCYAHHE